MVTSRVFRVFFFLIVYLSTSACGGVSESKGPEAAVAESVIAYPANFPDFQVPGHEGSMSRLRELFYLHFQNVIFGATLWDSWIPMASLWPAPGSESAGKPHVESWRKTLLNRRIDQEGYVSTHQHPGQAHNDGWPFPLPGQVGGVGFYFSSEGIPYYGDVHKILKSTDVSGWELSGAKSLGFDDVGWKLELTGPGASLTTPVCQFNSFVAPFVRLEWQSSGLEESANCYVEWATEDQPEFETARRVYFSSVVESDGLAYSMIRLYEQPGWKGTVTRLRFNFDNRAAAKVTIRSLITSVDSRHNVNSFSYIQGCYDYVSWTGDLSFLRANMRRMRLALRHAIDEFEIRKYYCVNTPWSGHDGRSGLVRAEDGSLKETTGGGIGNSYFDILPLGGKDALATIYCYDAMTKMARLEQLVSRHGQWDIPQDPLRFEAKDLFQLAQKIKATAGEFFWNKQTQRFVAAIDVDGKAYDYGFTFVNLEAIYYDFATASQARSIMDWIDGKRIVAGDTSKGDDIYHWRFAPRATTKRNLDYYTSAWTGPETIDWGDQIQDGGAVLGFSYHDLMSRLTVNGADDSWQRFAEILKWFGEVQSEGGYRAYYSVPGRGLLQGGGPPGGLGMDREFVESILVPQTMLYGYLGFEPRLDGFAIRPDLPSDWPELTITQIQFHKTVLDITANSSKIIVSYRPHSSRPLVIYPPVGHWKVQYRDHLGKAIHFSDDIHIENDQSGISLRTDQALTVELFSIKP